MSKCRKSLVLTSAITPVLFYSSAFAGAVGVTVTIPANSEWAPNSVPGGSLQISSGTNAAGGGPATTGGPGPITFDSQVNALNNVNGGDQFAQQVLGETFLTGSTGFALGAFQVVQGGGGSSAAPGTFSLHLFQLTSPAAGLATYTLGNGGVEVGNDLLGGGNGVTLNLPGANNATSVTEFDFTGSDHVALLPNTEYSLEMWNSGVAGNTSANAAYFSTSKTDTYTNGVVIGRGTTDPTVLASMEQDHSTQFRSGNPVGTTTNLLFAIYDATVGGPAFFNSTTSANWNDAAQWSSGVVPNASGAEADFLSPSSTFANSGTFNGKAYTRTNNGLTASGNVFTDTPVTVGFMNFDNSAASYVIDGAGSLTLQTGSGNAQINVFNGSHKINVPLTIASNTILAISSGATLNIGDPVTINAGITLSKSGAGTVNYLSTIKVLSGGVINFASPTTVQSLALTGSAQAVVANHGTGVVNTLQLDSLSTDIGSKVDLTNNALVLHGGSLASVATQLGTVQAALKNGFNAHAGYWNGTNGIVSSSAAADTSHLTTLGYMQSNGGTFNGVATTTNDVLVKYTYYGDANLDGVVNGADYQQIDMGFGTGGTTWSTGDFNYDGVVNGSDFALIDNTFNQLTASGAGSLALVSSPLAEVGAGVSAVPEPTSLGLLGIGALSLLRRRRIKI